MADIFDELSKKMGLNTSSPSSTSTDNSDVFDQLSMSFGLTPDTRPKPTEPTMQEKISQRQLPSFDLTDSPLMQDVTKADPHLMYDKPAGPANPVLPGRDIPVIGSILKGLDWVASNPVSEAVAEYTVPDAPYLDQPGTNARQSFLDRSGQEAATGVSKFIGQAAAPFFVPGAGLGTGSAARGGAEALTSRLAPGLGQNIAREAAIGGAVGFGSEYAQGQGDLGQAAITGAAGAALGGAFPLLGAGVRSASNAAGRSFAQAAERPSLGAAVNDFMRRVDAPNEAPITTDRITDNVRLADDSQRFADNFDRVEQYNSPQAQANRADSVLEQFNQSMRQKYDPANMGDDVWAKMNRNEKTQMMQFRNAVNPSEAAPTPEAPQSSGIRGFKVGDEAIPTTADGADLSGAKKIIDVQSKDGVTYYRFEGETTYMPENMVRKSESVVQPAPREPVNGKPDIQNPSDGSHLKLPDYLKEPIVRNNQLAERLGLADEIEQLSRQRKTRKEISQIISSKLPQGADANEVVSSVRSFREIPSMDDKLEFEKWINNTQSNYQPRKTSVMPQTLKSAARGPKEGLVPQQPRGFTETLINSDKTAPGLRDRLKSAYTPITNETSVAQANKRIKNDLEAAASYVVSKSPLSAEKVTTAHRVINEFSKAGNFERANDVADKIAAELTKAGQSIQAASIYNRLTPEGILVHANRIAQRINERLPITAKEVKVTPDMAAQITDLAQTTQRMTGVKELSNDVMNILEKAKTGEKLTDTEAASLKNFVNESKQFIKETTRPPKAPRPPQEPKDKRVRDNVVSFLDAQEQAAKERLRARGIQISSTPLDVWADYAVIGAAKLGKGTVKFADWSEAMVKDLGESIRPQLQQLYEHSVQAYNQSSKVVTKQTISEAEKLAEKVVANKEITGPQADSIRSLAQKVSRLSGDEKTLAAQDLQQILQTLDRPGVLKKISSTQTIGQLLNPKTQVRNALGNELFYRVERLNKIASTPIDIIRSKITGGDRTVTFKTNNQGEYWKNWMLGLKAGWKGTNVNGLETQYDLGSPSFRGKYNPLTYMEKSLGAALKSFDTAAYMRAYNNTLGEMATLRTMNEGQRGNKELIQKYIREADDNMMKIADEYGRYVTFQDNNAISNTLVKAKRTLNLGKDFGLGDLILKYPKTPGAILMRALEYSPAGFIRSGMILARPWMKKEPNTAEVTQALSRAMVGTFGLTGLGYFLMDNGVVTGSASKDRDVRDLQKSAGQGQYQVNLSALKRLAESGFDTAAAKLKEGDLLYTYDWMQPISMAISMGANISKNMSEGKQKLSGLAGTAYNSVEGGLGTLTEQSVLQGLKRAAQGSPGQTVTDKITDILSDIPASFVPTAANQTKQLTDNSRPETYSPNKLEQSLNRAQAKIPGLAGKLPKQYDTLGRPKENYQDNNAANVLLNPGFASRYELSPEAKMVVDLINETGDETLAPRVPSKSITVDGKSVKLTGDQFSRFQKLQGEETQKEIVKRYKPGESLKSRSKRMEDILRDSGTKARDQLKKEIK